MEKGLILKFFDFDQEATLKALLHRGYMKQAAILSFFCIDGCN